MVNGLWNEMVAWFKQPFKSEGSAFNWVLFVGLLVIAAFFWQLILLEITREV